RPGTSPPSSLSPPFPIPSLPPLDRGSLIDPPTFILLTEQVQALQRDKEILKTNLNKAEEEVKLLFEENIALDEANKRLLCLLEKEQKHRSERKHSAVIPPRASVGSLILSPLFHGR
uniref:Protein CASP n=1 Tax=Aegilops tauschii subsp. strangulata TaxID=200361 RepID=A0A452ZBH2_AEGTS